jgi:hypothetical protein
MRPLLMQLLEDRIALTTLTAVAQSSTATRGGTATFFIDVDTLSDNSNGPQNGLSGGSLVVFFDATKLSIAAIDGNNHSSSISVGSTYSTGTNPDTSPVDIGYTVAMLSGSTSTNSELAISLSGTNGYQGTSGGHLIQINFNVMSSAAFGGSAYVSLVPHDTNATTGISDVNGTPYDLGPNFNQDTGAGSTATVTISGTDHAPVAVNDSYNAVPRDVPATGDRANSPGLTTTFGSTLYPSVVANDTDSDTGDTPSTFTAVKDTSPSHGTLTFNSDGSFNYLPDSGYLGTDSFTYHVVDTSGMSSNSATVNIRVGTMVSIPTNLTANTGSTVTVPVYIDNANPGGTLNGTGASGFSLHLTYDSSVFTVANSDISLGSINTAGHGSGWTMTPNAGTGTIDIAVSSGTVTTSSQESIVNIVFHVLNSAAVGASPINILSTTSVDAGDSAFGLPLSPAPTDANTDSVDGVVTVSALAPDLTVAKSGPANMTQGQTSTYTYTVTNSGSASSTTEQVTVTDVLPAGTGVTFDTSVTSSGGWTIAYSDNLHATATFTPGSAVAAGSSYPTFALKQIASASAGTTGGVHSPNFSDTTTVSTAADNNSNTSNDTASTTTGLTQVAASITPTPSTAQSALYGTAFSGTFNVTVDDAGGAPIQGQSVVYTVNTVAGATGSFASSFTGGTTDATGTVTSTTFTANGSAGSYTITANTSPTALGSPATFNLTNTSPDLTVTKSHTGNFTQGSTGTYTYTVTNAGTATTSGTVTLTDTLPTGLGVTFTASQDTTTIAGWLIALSNGGRTVTATRSDTANASGSFSALALSVDVAANAGTSGGNHVTVGSAASVSGGGEATNVTSNNNSTNDTTTINQVAAAISVVSGNNQTAQTGSNFTNALVVLVADAGGVGVPGATVNFSATPSSGGASATFTGNPATTGSNGQASVTATANATADVNSYTVTANTSPTALGTAASFTLTNSAAPAVDFTIAKSHTGNFTQGSTGTYTLTVSNIGTASSSGTVTVTDTLPTGMTATSFSGTGWTIVTGTGGSVQATRTTALAGGSSYPTLTVVVSVSASAGSSGGVHSTLTNSATVSGGGDNSAGNNTANDVTTITQVAAAVVTSGGGQSTTVNTAFTNPLVVTVNDAGGAPVSGVSVTFAAPGTGASGSFTGGVNGTTDSNGQVSKTFTANTTAGAYSVTATATGVSGTSTFSETNTADVANHFAVTVGSTTQAKNIPFNFTVTVQDQYNNRVTGYTGTVGFTSSDTASGVSVPANYTFTSGSGADNGQHVFSATLETTSATQTITATDTNTNTITGTSPAITVTASGFSVQPANPANAMNLQGTGGTSITVTLAPGSFSTNTNNPTYVTLALVGSPGTLAGTTVAVANTSTGQAVFSNLHISNGSINSTYQLTASVGSNVVATSSSFALTGAGGGSATTSSLSFTNQPAATGNSTGTSTIAATLTGNGGSAISVTLAGGPFSTTQYVTMSLSGGPGTLVNNLAVADSSTGVATFTNLGIKGGSSTATYTLTASVNNGSSIVSTTSTSFTLTGTGTGGGGGGGGGGGNTGGSTTTTSASFTVGPAATGNTTGSAFIADRLTGGTGGSGGTAIQVTLTVSPFSTTQYVTLSLSGGPGTLVNNVAPATSAGVATFSSLAIKGGSASSTYTLTATVNNGGSTVTTTSSSFTLTGSNINSGSATSGTFTVSPAASGNEINGPLTGGSGGAGGTPISVTVNGAPFSSTQYVELKLFNGSTQVNNILGGTLVKAANSSGVATFSDLTMKNAQTGVTYTLEAFVGSTLVATSSSFTLSPEFIAGGAIVSANAQTVTTSQLAPIVNAAIARWAATGISAAQVATLKGATFQIANMDSRGLLGTTAGTTITIDDNADGYGWFIDATPMANEEFTTQVSTTQLAAAAGSAAAGHVDLLTVVMHELGHLIGYSDVPTAQNPTSLMADQLGPGVRRLPPAAPAPVVHTAPVTTPAASTNSAPPVTTPAVIAAPVTTPVVTSKPATTPPVSAPPVTTPPVAVKPTTPITTTPVVTKPVPSSVVVVTPPSSTSKPANTAPATSAPIIVTTTSTPAANPVTPVNSSSSNNPGAVALLLQASGNSSSSTSSNGINSGSNAKQAFFTALGSR